MSAIPFPDFFLVGAPRCGTSALARCFRKHPQICFSRPKEPHYFSRFYGMSEAPDIRRDYLDRCYAHFDPEHHRVLGEGSVTYLYSPEAIKRIVELNPDAKFIAMVRNPVEMIPSFHSLMCFYLEEDEQDFAVAWALQEERQRGRRVPKRCLDPVQLQYAEVGRLGRWVGELLQTAGAERCHVIVYDDFCSDPRSVYLDTLRFLGVDDDGRTDFGVKNASRTYRWKWLHRIAFWHPTRVERYVEIMGVRSKHSRLKRLRKNLVRRNSVKKKKSESIGPALRETLRREFADDTARLGELLGRDLSHWR